MNLGPSPGTDDTPTVANRLGMASLLLVMPRLTFFVNWNLLPCAWDSRSQGRISAGVQTHSAVISACEHASQWQQALMHFEKLERSFWVQLYGWGFEMIWVLQRISMLCGLKCFYPCHLLYGGPVSVSWMWSFSVLQSQRVKNPEDGYLPFAYSGPCSRDEYRRTRQSSRMTQLWFFHHCVRHSWDTCQNNSYRWSYPSAGLATWWYIWKTYGP